MQIIAYRYKINRTVPLAGSVPELSTYCVIIMCSVFKGWQWAEQWATLLHWALLAWHTWPPDSRPCQRSPDPGAEDGSRINAVSLPSGSGHRPGCRSLSEALGFGHCTGVCDRWKWQRAGLQLTICCQCHGGSTCRVSGISHSFMF